MLPRAFTLVETLVVIAVVAIVLSLVIPALSSARRSAEAERCRATLRGIGQASMLIAGDGRGVWPNQFLRSEPWVLIPPDAPTYRVTPLEQESLWPGAYIGVLWRPGEPGDAWECPAVHRFLKRTGTYLEVSEGDGMALAMVSSRQSSALFTDPALWDPDQPDRRLTPTRFARPVRVDEVQFPSAKVASVEGGDWHDPRTAETRLSFRLNTLFVDGHVRVVGPADSIEPALAIREDWALGRMREPIVFSSAPWGVRGVDLR